MTPNCIGEPVSWLRLELRHLGELPEVERGPVEDHLSRCEACRACAARIGAEGDRAPRPLPTLPALPAAPAVLAARRGPRLRTYGLSSLAAAAAVLAVVLVTRQPPPPELAEARAPARVRVKGGELALTLVRERAGEVERDPTRYAPGDRFKVLLTCPPGAEPFVEVVVFEGREGSLPLPAGQTLVCGNQTPVGGALRLDGAGPVEVCAVVASGPIDRASLAAGLLALDGRQAVCARLEPALPPRR